MLKRNVRDLFVLFDLLVAFHSLSIIPLFLFQKQNQNVDDLGMSLSLSLSLSLSVSPGSSNIVSLAAVFSATSRHSCRISSVLY
jgi:hypothetical protein